MEIFFDQEEFLVIDNGTGSIKAGFSGQDLPRLEIPTVVGEHTEQVDPNMVNQNSGEMPEDKKISHLFGNAALAEKDTHELFYPIDRGIVKNWDYMELIWTYIFDELNLETKNVNVLMTDSPFNTKLHR